MSTSILSIIAAETQASYDPWGDCDTLNQRPYADAEPAKDSPGREATTPSPYAALITAQGEPFLLGKQGTYTINEMFFAARFAASRDMLYEPSEARFYIYEASTGVWEHVTENALKVMVAADIMEFVTIEKTSGLALKRTDRVLTAITAILRGLREKRGAFDKPHGLVHVSNGMLDLSSGTAVLKPFGPDYCSRNQTPFDYEPAATCDRFIKDLLKLALCDEDIDLLQRWAGSLLLGGNQAQRMMIMTGLAGGGKSTLVTLFESIIGTHNLAELRIKQLGERFEKSRFIGKQLLVGKDVRSDFLSDKSVSHLKSLTGGDRMTVELKSSNEVVPLRGNFGVVITSNADPRLTLDDDAEAWRRRLLTLLFKGKKPATSIPDFAGLLVREEGKGILRWMVEGAIKHMAELKSHGGYVLTPTQQARIDDMLGEADSAGEFVRHGLVVDKTGDLTSEEALRAYQKYCDARDWTPVSDHAFQGRVKALLKGMGIAQRHDIDRCGFETRGYRGIRVAPQGTATEPDAKKAATSEINY
jgi:P4 family phage/plasmid primase-like protien